ncbi:MAG: hypothetical protein JXA13_03970 [Anaerolineales bacterium]|nr:hypothetical protein [Anaerolineales bacterium]
MKRFALILALVLVLVFTPACGFLAGAPAGSGNDPGDVVPEDTAETQPPAQQDGNEAGGYYDFPLTKDAKQVMEVGNGGVNYQTEMGLDEVIAFYREELVTKQGLKEREILTSITDTTISMVFDGHPSGQAIVVQGVDLGGGAFNVNIRFEDI